MGTSHQCCTKRKVIYKEVTAGGRFESFLNSDQIIRRETQTKNAYACKNLEPTN